MPEADQNQPTDSPERQTPSTTEVEAPVADASQLTPDPPATGQEPALGDTSGMGTVLALGCIGGTVFLIVLGLIYLLITQLFG